MRKSHGRVQTASITAALATGTPLASLQAAAGHARGETTLGYAQAVDARRARKALKLRYG